MNAFFDSQFKYCLLIWKCQSCTNKRKIDTFQERCLRIIYNDKQSSFKELPFLFRAKFLGYTPKHLQKYR